MRNRFFQGAFARATAVLVGGTAGAQLINFLALPLLTRLYSPEDFEIFAVFLAIVVTLSAIACFRFEIAISLPEKDEDAADLTVVSIIAAFFFAIILMAILIIFGGNISRSVYVSRIGGWVWLIPVAVIFAGVYGAVQFWSSRKRRFGHVAKTKIFQVGAGVGIQLGSGISGFAPMGLLLGHVVTAGAGAISLILQIYKNDWVIFSKITLMRIIRKINQYKVFATYSTVEALANVGAMQVPILIIATLTVGPEAGYMMLAAKVMGAPLQLIGGSISQVYLSRAPSELRDGNLDIFTRKILLRLTIIGVPLLSILSFVAPWIFQVIFGKEWERAGVLVQWMAPWFVLQLLSSPVSMIFHVTGAQRTAMLLQIFGFFLRVGFVLAAWRINEAYVVEAYAISGAIFYGLYLMLIIGIMKRNA